MAFEINYLDLHLCFTPLSAKASDAKDEHVDFENSLIVRSILMYMQVTREDIRSNKESVYMQRIPLTEKRQMYFISYDPKVTLTFPSAFTFGSNDSIYSVFRLYSKPDSIPGVKGQIIGLFLYNVQMESTVTRDKWITKQVTPRMYLISSM